VGEPGEEGPGRPVCWEFEHLEESQVAGKGKSRCTPGHRSPPPETIRSSSTASSKPPPSSTPTVSSPGPPWSPRTRLRRPDSISRHLQLSFLPPSPLRCHPPLRLSTGVQTMGHVHSLSDVDSGLPFFRPIFFAPISRKWTFQPT
jgi:hypothetical protein